MKERIYLTYVPLYNISLRLIVTPDVDASCSKRGFPPGGYEGVTLKYKGNIYIVVTKRASEGTVTHEAVHAASEILSSVGVKFSYSNQEPLSYLTGWIAEWAAKKLKRSKPPKRV